MHRGAHAIGKEEIGVPTGAMNGQPPFHILIVGWKYSIVEDLVDRIAAKSQCRFSYVMHPESTSSDRAGRLPDPRSIFFAMN